MPPAVAARLPATRAIIIVLSVAIVVSIVRGEGEVPVATEDGRPRFPANVANVKLCKAREVPESRPTASGASSL